MKAAGVFIVTGGLDVSAPVFTVDASSGTPLFTDGPFVESKEHLGGFAVVGVFTDLRRSQPVPEWIPGWTTSSPRGLSDLSDDRGR
jgi:hypothetical protein